MTLHQMHQMFRAFGQQTGLQQVRGTLPEILDLFLNDAINELVQTGLINSVRTAFQETSDTQASTMAAINNFRTLYKTVRYPVGPTEAVADNSTKIVGYYEPKNSFHVINVPVIGSGITDGNDNAMDMYISPMMYLGFSIEYSHTLRGRAVACRTIGSDVLETTLRDFCNGASADSPIVCLKSVSLFDTSNNEDVSAKANEQLEIYIGASNCPIQYITIKYIKTPAVVKWNESPEECIDCDLPSHLHYAIVESAVLKYQRAIQQTIPQQQQQTPVSRQQQLAHALANQQ